MAIDYRKAVNAISDVVQNRPPPLREFDQIYMKAGDMVTQAHFIADRFRDLDVVFIGDGDAIALCIMHLRRQEIIDFGPKSIQVLDFDERIANSIVRFADKYQIGDLISSTLYNVVDALPQGIVGTKGAFYTNPPWGASNGGESVNAFMLRGAECVGNDGLGAMVIGDEPTLQWTKAVLKTCQQRMIELGFLIAEMVPSWHSYHLDDAPDLKSCTAIFRRVDPAPANVISQPLEEKYWKNFYGRGNPLRYRYVREKETLNYGKAPEGSYSLERLE